MSASTDSNGAEDLIFGTIGLGHSTYSKIELPKHTSKATKRPCLVCLIAKLQKLPFSLSKHKLKKKKEMCFDLIHCDLWVHVVKSVMMVFDIF